MLQSLLTIGSFNTAQLISSEPSYEKLTNVTRKLNCRCSYPRYEPTAVGVEQKGFQIVPKGHNQELK